MKRKLDLTSSDSYYASSSSGSDTINRWTGRPFSSRYHEILRKRKNLPVYEFKDELVRKVRDNQVIIVEGETGSGKVLENHFMYICFSFYYCVVCVDYSNPTISFGFASSSWTKIDCVYSASSSGCHVHFEESFRGNGC